MEVLERVKEYDPNSFWTENVVQLTLLYGSYIGHIQATMRGNVLGLDVFESGVGAALDLSCVQSDCNFAYGDEADLFYVELHSSTSSMELELTEHELRSLIVAVEIVKTSEYRIGG
jgi:hypothetical protein